MFTLTPSSTNLSDGPGNVKRDRPRGRRIRQNDQNDRQRRREFIHVDSSETQPLDSLVRWGGRHENGAAERVRGLELDESRPPDTRFAPRCEREWCGRHIAFPNILITKRQDIIIVIDLDKRTSLLRDDSAMARRGRPRGSGVRRKKSPTTRKSRGRASWPIHRVARPVFQETLSARTFGALTGGVARDPAGVGTSISQT
jgi:hypothetical protein